MEPDYSRLDPQERSNKYMALASFFFGMLSLCAGLIPICGGISGIIGIMLGIFGRRSEERKIAAVGIALSALGIMISFIYAFLVFIKNNNP
jgi:phosphoglycerol transferase MdoB-like AlkP superfamily enzyme